MEPLTFLNGLPINPFLAASRQAPMINDGLELDITDREKIARISAKGRRLSDW